MADAVHLGLEDVLRIHVDQIERYGGEHGLRDAGLLASALAAPRAGIGDERFHATLPEQAAVYLVHIVRNHPFVDGNKRTGVATAFVFLILNGIEIVAAPDSVVDLTIAVADGRATVADVAEFLRTHSQPLAT